MDVRYETCDRGARLVDIQEVVERAEQDGAASETLVRVGLAVVSLAWLRDWLDGTTAKPDVQIIAPEAE